ncbi:MAG: hypothetical protein ACQES9_11380 [Myxococcota bacterium]
MLNSKFKFFTIFFMLSTAFILSAGCKKKGEASCEGIWDKFQNCPDEKDKKGMESLFGSKDEFIKRCEKVKDDEEIKGLMKVATKGCDAVETYVNKNEKVMEKLMDVKKIQKEAQEKMKKMKAKKEAQEKMKKMKAKKEAKKKEVKKEEKKEEQK